MDPSSPASSRKRDRGEEEPDSQLNTFHQEEEEAMEEPFPTEDQERDFVDDSDQESEGEDLFGDQLDR